jgi:Tetratricopeptide repeat
MCLDDLGELDRAAALHREARRIAEEVGDAEGIVRTYINLSHVLVLASRSHEALTTLGRATSEPTSSAWSAGPAAMWPATSPPCCCSAANGRNVRG